MIGNLIPDYGTYLYLEKDDRQTLKEQATIKGQLLGTDAQQLTPLHLTISNPNTTNQHINYTCDRQHNTHLSIDEHLYDTIDQLIDHQGKAQLPYRNANNTYHLIIADVLKLRKYRDDAALELYDTLQQHLKERQRTKKALKDTNRHDYH